MSKFINASQLAKELNVNHTRISRAVKDGILDGTYTKKKKRYSFDKEKAIQAWKDNINPSSQMGGQVNKALHEVAQGNKTETAEALQAPGIPKMAQSKAVREAFEAKIAQLKYKEMAGKLISSDEVKTEAYKTAKRVRETIMNIPNRTAVELASMKDPHQIEMYLLEQLSDALKSLKGN